VGYLTGPIVDRANLDSYDTIMKYLRKIGDGEVEVKKNMVYKGSERKWCITIHSMKSTVEEVDFGLCKMSAKNQTHVKYVSFKNSTKADRIAGLKLNQLLNIRLKYEWLEDIKVLEKVIYKGR